MIWLIETLLLGGWCLEVGGRLSAWRGAHSLHTVLTESRVFVRAAVRIATRLLDELSVPCRGCDRLTPYRILRSVARAAAASCSARRTLQRDRFCGSESFMYYSQKMAYVRYRVEQNRILDLGGLVFESRRKNHS